MYNSQRSARRGGVCAINVRKQYLALTRPSGRINGTEDLISLCCDPGTFVPSIYIILVPDHGQHPNRKYVRVGVVHARENVITRTIYVFMSEIILIVIRSRGGVHSTVYLILCTLYR